jgi:ankyrin repeat protein
MNTRNKDMASQPAASQDLIDELVGNAHGNLARVKEILSAHPEMVNAAARWGETPIQAAAQMGDKAMTEYLLNQGAPLDICTAAMLGMADTVKVYLIDEPQLARATGAHGIPLLYFTVLHNEVGIADLLLRRGARVNDGDGRMTALHGAAIFNKPEMAAWLLKKGARRDVRDANGKTPLQLAEEKGYADVAALLRGK